MKKLVLLVSLVTVFDLRNISAESARNQLEKANQQPLSYSGTRASFGEYVSIEDVAVRVQNSDIRKIIQENEGVVIRKTDSISSLRMENKTNKSSSNNKTKEKPLLRSSILNNRVLTYALAGGLLLGVAGSAIGSIALFNIGFALGMTAFYALVALN
ncbi:MAG: hypothetical protein HY399_00895 [Elusimicrobia bacterium]|nr:hypothetical protein [Elusimicrobiota bacterium]